MTTRVIRVIPDAPGCYSVGETFEEALINAKEALEAHFELLAEQEELPPLATNMENHYASPEFAGWVWALVDLDIEPFMGKASKINVTLSNLLTRKIDELVKTQQTYKSRSYFLQVAASHELDKAIS